MFDELFESEHEELILRPEQAVMVEQLNEMLKTYNKVILMAGCGVGKTAISTHMIKEAIGSGNRCLFVNDRRVLVRQTSAVFDRFGVDHGVIMASHKRYKPYKRVQVASIATMKNRKLDAKFDLIFIDEAHTITKGHLKLFANNPDAKVIGLTATPFSKGLGKIFEHHIEPYPVRVLIERGLLCDFEVYGPETFDLSKVSTVAGEYHQGQLATAVDQTHLVADVVQTYLKLGKGRKTICFAHNIAHGKHLEREFMKHGIKASQINCDQDPESRRCAMNGFKEDELEVLISVEILIKGFDVTSVDCIVWATATKSPIKWIQGCGRGLRTHPGKTIARIIDHGSNCARLGFPDEFDFVELDKGNKNKSATKTKDRPESKPKKCPSCDFLKPAGVSKCPACGLIPDLIKNVDVVDGKIIRLDRKRKEKEQKVTDEMLRWASGLKSLGKEKGYKPGWAYYTWKGKFKREPNFSFFSIPFGPITLDIENYVRYKTIKYSKSKSANNNYKYGK